MHLNDDVEVERRNACCWVRLEWILLVQSVSFPDWAKTNRWRNFCSVLVISQQSCQNAVIFLGSIPHMLSQLGLEFGQPPQSSFNLT
jgi:hypothetical protein